MKKTNFGVGSFFAFVFVVLIAFFLFNAIMLPNNSGATLAKDPSLNNNPIYNRVSYNYITKSVSKAQNMMEKSTSLGEKLNVINDRQVVNPSKLVYGKTKGAESGSANLVTSIVVNYRGFDTLGEVTVLFVSITGVGIILYGMKEVFCGKPSLIVSTGSKVLFPLIVLFGAYIFVHGHLTPGGGFPGGAVIASGILLLIVGTFGYKLKEGVAKLLEAIAGSTFVIIGILGLTNSGSFLANFLPTGTLGALFSAGTIALVYIAIGVKVGSELSTVVADLKGGEDN
jgi:multicomponent Na+:H+ antiporter subunit B